MVVEGHGILRGGRRRWRDAYRLARYSLPLGGIRAENRRWPVRASESVSWESRQAMIRLEHTFPCRVARRTPVSPVKWCNEVSRWKLHNDSSVKFGKWSRRRTRSRSSVGRLSDSTRWWMRGKICCVSRSNNESNRESERRYSGKWRWVEEVLWQVRRWSRWLLMSKKEERMSMSSSCLRMSKRSSSGRSRRWAVGEGALIVDSPTTTVITLYIYIWVNRDSNISLCELSHGRQKRRWVWLDQWRKRPLSFLPSVRTIPILDWYFVWNRVASRWKLTRHIPTTKALVSDPRKSPLLPNDLRKPDAMRTPDLPQPCRTMPDPSSGSMRGAVHQSFRHQPI